MKTLETPIAGVTLVEPDTNSDERGAFTRLYCERDFASLTRGRPVVQANHSRNAHRATVRGLHYQVPPHAEAKLIRCTRGSVFDVAIDLRAGSPTYRSSFDVILSAERGQMIFLPEGIAHGFQTLEDDSELLYFHTAFYEPSAAQGVAHDDDSLAIRWPLAVDMISARDRALPTVADREAEGLLPLSVE